MEFKEYQTSALAKFDRYLTTLLEQETKAAKVHEVLLQAGLEPDPGDPCAKAWDQLNQERRLPLLRDAEGREVVSTWIARHDGLRRSIPNVCLKVPTGGGKTLLATAALERLQTDYFKRQTGFVLWVVPSDAIYKQTWKQLANREHPYRQMLERASGGRVKLLEKSDAFTERDVQHFLCVMLLMLPSAARQSKETLRMFRDSGRYMSFFPPEDDPVANEALIKKIPNLKKNDLADLGWKDGVVPGWRSVRQSLGNVLCLLRPAVIVDEGHKAYSATARETLNEFNPAFILELSATPNADGRHSSNILVSVPGTALKEEEMIKLPINVTNEEKGGWKHTLTLAHAKLEGLAKEAKELQTAENRYIRPIMLVRVERTGSEQRDSNLIHAQDAREYLIEKLGVPPEEIRLKTSEKDDLGDEDLMQPICEVRYIITKAALQEGWDCPFAYVLAILSKTTASTSLTQMIGRVLRQPHARLTSRPALNECYVFTFDQDVEKAVDGVRRGLQDEGMADLAAQVKLSSSGPAARRMERREKIAWRKKFAGRPVFLPRVLHRDGPQAGDLRVIDYDRDILGELDWESFRFSEAFMLSEDDKLHRTIARINVTRKQGKDEAPWELIHEDADEMPEEGLDLPFLVRQLLDVIPNPWQGMRILKEALDSLRQRGATERQLFTNRLDLLREMKRDLRRQVNEASEVLFARKLAEGDIQFRLVSSDDSELNWKLAETLEVDLTDDDKAFHRKNGDGIEKSVFEKVFQRDFNGLEKDTAWYLDGLDCVHWWHRIAVNQGSYALQGWQRSRVFPDFLACVHGVENGKFRFTVLETKGDHLKGNDDTEYKAKLFELLTRHDASTHGAGQLLLGTEPEQVSFTMLMESSWKQSLIETFES